MPNILLNSREVTYPSDRDWRLKYLMGYMGDMDYQIDKSAFANLSHSIIEQMLSMKAGRAAEERLKKCCGGELTPETVSILDVETIRKCGISERKAQSLMSLADYALNHNLENMKNAQEEEVYETLLKLPGIGKRTCDMFLLFYLCRPDILPTEDGALRRIFRWLYRADLSSSDSQNAVCALLETILINCCSLSIQSAQCGNYADHETS